MVSTSPQACRKIFTVLQRITTADSNVGAVLRVCSGPVGKQIEGVGKESSIVRVYDAVDVGHVHNVVVRGEGFKPAVVLKRKFRDLARTIQIHRHASGDDHVKRDGSKIAGDDSKVPVVGIAVTDAVPTTRPRYDVMDRVGECGTQE